MHITFNGSFVNTVIALMSPSFVIHGRKIPSIPQISYWLILNLASSKALGKSKRNASQRMFINIGTFFFFKS
ncbi:hypothetical protein D3C85_1642660 [compost metagenome]